jgi:hypothetical protein
MTGNVIYKRRSICAPKDLWLVASLNGVHVMQRIIYKLIDPRQPAVPEYVGITKDKERRLSAHLRIAQNENAKPVYAWIRGLLHVGVTPKIIKIEKADIYRGVTEGLWIANCRLINPELKNVSAGEDIFQAIRREGIFPELTAESKPNDYIYVITENLAKLVEVRDSGKLYADYLRSKRLESKNLDTEMLVLKFNIHRLNSLVQVLKDTVPVDLCTATDNFWRYVANDLTTRPKT